MKSKLTHRPKGSMCQVCNHANDNCGNLDFTKMRKIGKDKDGVIVVKCDFFERCSNGK